MLSAIRSASAVLRRISVATLGSTSMFVEAGVKKVLLPKCGKPRTSGDSTIGLSRCERKLRTSCFKASSNPPFTCSKSSTSRAMVGRNDEASAAPCVAPCPPRPSPTDAPVAERPALGEMSSSSPSLSADELLGLIWVASSIPGNGCTDNPFEDALSLPLFDKAGLTTEVFNASLSVVFLGDSVEATLPSPSPKKEDFEVRVKEGLRVSCSPSFPSFLAAGALLSPSCARRA
mmetsp:Transcript_86823/g.163761  ORF Transcript_86823/g.163761 Transcript_86823/m.163761 type:complete len:232 (+) Transcript_86823:2302-2997(+)